MDTSTAKAEMKSVTLVLIGEGGEVITEAILSAEEFTQFITAAECAGETFEEFVNNAIREGVPPVF